MAEAKSRSKNSRRETQTDLRPVKAGRKSKTADGRKTGRSENQAKRPEKNAGISKEPEYTQRNILHQIVAGIVLLAAGMFFVLSLHTDLTGTAGNAVADGMKGLFGLGAYLLAYLMIIYALFIFAGKTAPFKKSTIFLLLVVFFMIDIINAGRFLDGTGSGKMGTAAVYDKGVTLDGGGVFGMYAGKGLYSLFGSVGLYLLCIVVIIVCLLLIMKTGVSDFFDRRAAKKAHERSIAESRENYKDASRFSDSLRKKKHSRDETVVISIPDSSESENRREKDHEIKKHSFADMEKRQQDAKKRRAQEKQEEKKKTDAAKKKKSAENPAAAHIIELVKQEKNLGKTDPYHSGRERKINVYGADEACGKGKKNDPHPEENDIRDQEPVKRPAMETPAASDPGIVKETGAADIPDGFGPSVGGASAATAASETENSEGEVSDTPKKRSHYKLPPVSLLNMPSAGTGAKESDAELRDRALQLEQTLASFHVDARVVNIISGPSVTRYEIEPARGVKVQSITRLSDDIALNMRAQSIRIEAPIPGKAAVGIEIENESRQMVSFREIVDSDEFRNHKSKMAFTVGRDIGGKPVVADLAKMPHMLIAGATGSGKSVCINTIICSILYKARPEEVRMVLVDPKMVELGNYNGIPHLLIPVVTDANKAATALNWAVSEMTDRYRKFADTGVRKIAEYNKLMRTRGEKDEILPQIVIIIDELADLMMVASSQVEDSICRLAQLARAAGMHLVIATQRPSVDVITGLIKANIPSRIAFTVSSQIDSRTIIDMPGAEKLVGNGDMLFKPQDLNKPKRIQGPFIDDDEVERIIEYVKSQGAETQYNQEVIEHIEQGKSFEADDEEDELMKDAAEMVINAGQASVSMLQRRFRIGYNRAARIVESLERKGIIGPQDGSRPRQVLMTQEQFEQMQEDA